MNRMVEFEQFLAARAAEAEAAIARLLPERPADRLRDAMRYAALGGGKRLRPFLVMESAALFGAGADEAARVAVALECVHCYSLVHDDLPAMDDDDMRRGRPTTHRQYDEATAILAGDALLTHAFAILADPLTHTDPARRAELVGALATAAGDDGMCGGQMRDIQAETAPLDEKGILAMQAMKTGALFRFACLAGAILVDAGREDRQAMDTFARGLGVVFQVADDLLDEESSAEALGKAAGKDRERGKATLPALVGAGAARAVMAEETGRAEAALERFGERAQRLRQALQFAARRRS
ncbi:MAG: polyprenyl synthetase family protein [Rhodobiaceae bacterium]|nr:polyprenyl synthetase family protein [Rhodobiaceae bacterium]MCC0056807.1 polyprenyl synthetase family protein [Rhodobiaceae bacterium]